MSLYSQAFRKTRLLGRAIAFLVRDYAGLGNNLSHLLQAWRDAGVHGLKGALLRLRPRIGPDSWPEYRRTYDHAVRPRIAQRIARDGAPIKISVLVPTYNTPASLLDAMLRSVHDQIYPNWELCIADDASSQPHVRQMLQQHAAEDSRIKVHLSADNRGVSHASNCALAMATGPFTVLLDHDDLLEPQALFRVAEAIAADDPDMLYSDELLLAALGNAVVGYVHRPAFSPEFLRGHPYIVHLVGFRTSLLREVGGFDEQLAISQDYDLILRASERAATVVHVPEILYQWRVHPASAGHQKMGDVMAASTAALQRHLDRSCAPGTVESGPGFNYFDVRYRVDPRARVAIVIPTKNHGALLRQCVDSIRATGAGADYDIVVVDHASDEPATLDYLRGLPPQIRVLQHQGPFNFSDINNRAVAQLGDGYTHYLFCNNDIEARSDGWLCRMLAQVQQPGVGIVGAQLLYPDGRTIQHAGVCVGRSGRADHYGKFVRLPASGVELGYQGRLALPHEVAAVTAACMLIRKETFEEIGGFDPVLAVGFGDVDLCLRATERGWRVLYCPAATLLHHESVSRGKDDRHPEDSATFEARWANWVAGGDPYFHPALALDRTDWQITAPLLCSFELTRRVWVRNAATGRQWQRHSPPGRALA